MKSYIIAFTATLLIIFSGESALSQGFLKVSGKEIVNDDGDTVLLRGIGLGGWMLQEPYMLQLSDVAGTQTEIEAKIIDINWRAELQRILFEIPEKHDN